MSKLRDDGIGALPSRGEGVGILVSRANKTGMLGCPKPTVGEGGWGEMRTRLGELGFRKSPVAIGVGVGKPFTTSTAFYVTMGGGRVGLRSR